MRELCREWGFANNLSQTQEVLQNMFASALARNQTIVCVCVGTDSVLGDCFGAVVGDQLLTLNLPIFLYGNTHNNVCARNINATMNVINLVHPDALIVVVDTMCSSDKACIGDIVLSDEYVGVNPSVKISADLFIYGITTYLSPTRHNLYARLNLIQSLSKTLCQCLSNAVQNATRQNSLAFLQNALN